MGEHKVLNLNFSDVAMQCKESIDRNNNPYRRYVEGGHIESETLKLRNWGEFGDQYVGPAFHRIFKKGQILYCSRRTYLKKIVIPDFDGITSNTTFVIEAKPVDGFATELLPFIMLSSSFTKYSILNSKGSTNPYINYKDLDKFEFSLPDISVQYRFLKILKKVQDNENALIETIQSIMELNDLVLANEVKKSKNTISLAELLIEARCQVKDVFSEKKYIGFEHIDPDDLYLRDFEEVTKINSQKNSFSSGDLLYGKIRPYLKKVALAEMDGICSSDILVLTPTYPEFSINISWYLKSTYFSKLAMASAKGSKMPRADWKVLREHRVPASLLNDRYTRIAREYYSQLLNLNKQLKSLKALQVALIDRILE